MIVALIVTSVAVARRLHKQGIKAVARPRDTSAPKT